MTDTERLDFLQALTKGYGNGWILRDSVSDRGMRLHETEQEGAKPTVREAIDAVMNQQIRKEILEIQKESKTNMKKLTQEQDCV